MLRLELAFYIGCINLRDRLLAKGEAVSELSNRCLWVRPRLPPEVSMTRAPA